jgi:hydrophobic/amphiphilic exporter-1 (mainly G- bacteria), HAE1 family
LGLVPMALGWGEGAEIRSPMAIAVIGGMVFSTMLTLIFIPVMYEILDRKRYPGDVPATERARRESPYIEGAATETAGD